MGRYINPKGMSKEQWLTENGEQFDESHFVSLKTIDAALYDNAHTVPVCLVDNGWMTAAGIAVDQRELEIFLLPDGRPKTWYLVPRDKLKQIGAL